MPGFDGTGPRGMGPMTGGGRGFCNPYSPSYAARPYGVGFGGPAWGGRGGGFGRGMGRGMGIRRAMWHPYAYGAMQPYAPSPYPYGGRFAYPPYPYGAAPYTPYGYGW